MRSFLLATTCSLALAGAAQAETSVSTKQTSPIRTGTIANGAADDIKITSTGSVELTTGGAAVTINTNHKVTNEGTIQVSNANNAAGIFALAGTSGSIVSSGKIIVDETYTPTDGDNDGDLDGPFAVGSDRFGITTAGAFTGNVTVASTGTIAIEGNDSYGIRLAGPLTGTLSHDGTTTVLGDRAIGVEAGPITGNVRLAGTVTAQGVNAIGAAFDGPIGGTLTIQGTITSTGYRYATPPTDTSKLDADDLLQGNSAVIVSDNVAGGIILAVPPKDNSTTDNDEDKDGIEDSKEGSAAVRSFGSAPAMRIGSATKDITIGSVPGTGSGYGLIIDGTIAGNGVYKDIAGNGLEIGGQGHAVTITRGIGISGTVSASSQNSSATAIHLGAGAFTPIIHVTGKVEATGSNAMSTLAGGIVIEQGATLLTVKNAGTIKATATGADGAAIAILDRSGTMDMVENSGTISATGAKADSGRNVAIDLQANTTGATIRQTAVAAGVAAPSIVGNILLGAGNDVLDIADGTITGNTVFGAGADTLLLSGDAAYSGDVFFGSGGGTMSLSGTSQFKGKADFGTFAGTLTIGTGTSFTGALASSGNLAIALSGGKLDLTAPAQVSSLAVTNKGVLAVTLGQAGNSTPILGVSGTASFAADSKLALRVTDINNAIGNHLILSAGTLTGAGNITTDTTQVPFLYKATLSSTANALNVALARKSNSELGLNRSESAAFDPVYAALSKDAKVAGAFLSITNGDTFRDTLRQMLPDHAGGVFQAVTQGSRTFGRMLEDPTGPFKDEGRWGYWISQVAWGVEKGRGDTASYETSGWGIGGGAEIKTGLGSFGGSVAYYWNRARDKANANQVRANQYELAAYWRLKSGGLRATARGAVSFIALDGTRQFEGTNGTDKVSLTASGDRGARLYSAAGSVSYEMMSGALSFRPVVAFDYYRLKEKGYTETGGGDAFNLAVRSRTSDEAAVTGSAVVGLNMGGEDQWSGWSRIELEAGRREIVGGSLGKTVAHFAGGNEFTLLPEDRESGWIGRLRGVAGNSGFQIGGELGAEQHQGNWALSLRASLRVGL